MPMWRVELDRRLLSPGEHARNPFLGGIPAPGTTVTMSVRAWEFEAKDEAEVRAILDSARAADLPAVRGYKLRSIQRIERQL